jgi:predicted alpha/beta superfamily hydrolase
MIAEQIQIHENFGSKHLAAPRNVMVYLPPGYGADAEQRYPVLYMHDAQNLFNPAEAFGGVVWGADETAQALILTGQIEPLMIVGIYNSGEKRIDEYTPVKSSAGKLRGRGGEADAYGRMIIEELKPFIDEHYLTRPEREYTGIGGSSLGGLVSLYLAFKRPDVFSRVAALSPSIWWANNHLIRETAKLPDRIPLRIWLDIGKKEGTRIKHQVRALKEMLLAQGWQHDLDFAYLEIPEARHDEAAWAARFDQVLKFLYPPMPA